jgi:hypothetical protein
MTKMCVTCSAMNHPLAVECWNCCFRFDQVFRYIDAENGVMYWLPADMSFAEFKAGGHERCARAEWK